MVVSEYHFKKLHWKCNKCWLFIEYPWEIYATLIYLDTFLWIMYGHRFIWNALNILVSYSLRRRNQEGEIIRHDHTKEAHMDSHTRKVNVQNHSSIISGNKKRKNNQFFTLLPKHIFLFEKHVACKYPLFVSFFL